MNIFNTQINSPGILTNAQKISKHASRQEYGQLFLNRISFDIQDLHVHFPKIILGILLLLGIYNFRLAFLALHFPCCFFLFVLNLHLEYNLLALQILCEMHLPLHSNCKLKLIEIPLLQECV